MRQQVNITAALVYDCDARLGADALHRAIMDDLSRIARPADLALEVRREVELMGRSITTLHEEAAIYAPADYGQDMSAGHDGTPIDDSLALARRVALANAAEALLATLKTVRDAHQYDGALTMGTARLSPAILGTVERAIALVEGA